jgi:site-specific recombinase XerD
MKRANGVGTCVFDPRIGRWRVRLSKKASGGARRAWLKEDGRAATFATEEEAARILAAISVVESGSADETIGTCRDMFEAELRRRDLEQDRRDQKNDWSTYRCWIAKADWIDWPPSAVANRHGVLWVERMLQTPVHGNGSRRAGRKAGVRKLAARATVKGALSLATTLFQRIVEKGKLTVNPFAGIRVPGKDVRKSEHFAWREVVAILRCEAIPPIERALLGFFFGTGGRHDEIFLTPLRNLVVEGDSPYWFVEYGSDAKGKLWGPKNEKQRTVPLFGLSLASAKLYRHLVTQAEWRNPKGLAFVSRREGRPRTRFRQWYDWLQAAGVRDDLDSYKMKHTCASLLIRGEMHHVIREMLGVDVARRKWTLDEIGQLFGHSSIEVTSRYAHFCEQASDRAAREMMLAVPKEEPPPPAEKAAYALKQLPLIAVSNDIDGGAAAGSRAGHAGSTPAASTPSRARRAVKPALSTARPRTTLQRKGNMKNEGISEPRIGFEPTTAALRSRRGSSGSNELGEVRGQAAGRTSVFLLSLAVLYSAGVDRAERVERAKAFLVAVAPLVAAGGDATEYASVIARARKIVGAT